MPFPEEAAQVLSRKDSGDPPENPLQKRSLPREHPAAPAFEAVPLKAPDPPGRLWKQGMWAGEGASRSGDLGFGGQLRDQGTARCERKAIVLSFFPSKKGLGSRERGGR